MPQDNLVYKSRFKFDGDVAACFTDMLGRSIPGYETMRELTYKVGCEFVKPGTMVMDLGCSNGLAVEPFIRRFGISNKFMLYDTSEPMLEECRRRFAAWAEQKTGTVTIINCDISDDIAQMFPVSLVLSILTVQFTPIEKRQRIIQSVYDALEPGGAFIFVEKVLGNSAMTDALFVEEYESLKRGNEYTDEQIKSKRESLSGVLVPVAAEWNESMLRSAGFNTVECFWRYLNFCGWVAVK